MLSSFFAGFFFAKGLSEAHAEDAYANRRTGVLLLLGCVFLVMAYFDGVPETGPLSPKKLPDGVYETAPKQFAVIRDKDDKEYTVKFDTEPPARFYVRKGQVEPDLTGTEQQ